MLHLRPVKDPGHFETHEVNGLTWRSTPEIRELDQETVSLLVRRFNNEDWGESNPALQEQNSRALQTNQNYLRGMYMINHTKVWISRYPGDSSPTVTLSTQYF